MPKAASASSGLRIIAPRRNLTAHLAEIWDFRELLAGLIKKELKVRYNHSTIGFVWSMAHPLFLLGVYTFVFSVLGSGFPGFSVWLLCGLIYWTLVSTTLTTSVQSITSNYRLVTKVRFPRAVLPLGALGSALLHFLLQFGTFMIIVVVLRHPVDFRFVWLLPIALLVTGVLLASMALFLSVMNVWARDTKHLLDLAMIALFWLNPIIYEYHRASGWFVNRGLPAWMPLLNPFTSVITTFQRAIFGSSTVGERRLLPDVGPMWYLRNLSIVGVISVVLLIVGLWMFDRSEGNFAEAL